ncbi:MAG: ABC transporter ATP-binding protein, partial [Actinomycetota bacterium]|nr:ABC transporter ATP-binding protein [Actinomycetota bacterium]
VCSGRVVEGAERHRLFATPRHPYTHGLIGAVPRVDPDQDDGSPMIHGSVDDHLAWTDACAFAPRCPRAIGLCRTTPPPVETVASRLLRCHNPVPATSA